MTFGVCPWPITRCWSLPPSCHLSICQLDQATLIHGLFMLSTAHLPELLITASGTLHGLFSLICAFSACSCAELPVQIAAPTRMDFPDQGHERTPSAERRNEPRPRGKPVDCKICRDTVYPTYQEPELWDKLRGKKPRRVYENEDGRLICPCKCSGTIKWVHESCLQEWRYSQAGSPSQWKCATCGYDFQFERMDWARRVRSPILALVLAVVIVLLTVFLLGFMGDRILDLWLDPAGTIYEVFGGETDDWDRDLDLDGGLGIPVPEIDEDGWGFHFLKGLFSLGLVGFVKAFLAMSPFQWWNLRTTGVIGGGGRRRGTGRDRLEDVNLTLVIIGAVTFFWVSCATSTSYAILH